MTANSSPRTAVITGGGSGLGRETAHAFADQGWNVLVVGRTESTLLETAKDRPGIETLAADVTDPQAPEQIVAAARRAFGRVDVLVNNAAMLGAGELAGVEREQAERQIGANLIAPIMLARYALDALTETRGTIVNISSAGSTGSRAWPAMSLYGAAKTGLDFLTRTWAVELAPRGIRVLGVAPGVVDTRSGPQMGLTDEQYDGFLTQIAERTPLGRVGRPDEIAWLVTQLCRPEAGYLTGVVIAADGALSLT